MSVKAPIFSDPRCERVEKVATDERPDGARASWQVRMLRGTRPWREISGHLGRKGRTFSAETTEQLRAKTPFALFRVTQKPAQF